MTPPRYSPEALAQLEEIETYLIERAGPSVADAYLDRLLDFCDGIATAPPAGHHRDDLLPGLRTRIFERHRVVCFLVTADDIHIIAIFSTVQDWEQTLRDR
ncbi:type II toxin-antitoxin system RelE/ParE family toxin [Tessaracoccus caeni]|uniref:type II toxin-antitoxin system RelE/ParE family toxin n=1 Tax=Tessaracoccus caeni TaxID=3031239 RepID=UPI0023DCB39B|nr:type II toxin-antitoxin system RelE/ParE family toxin [Tessaracoccus caeni]MDF1489208.1 type II toxin-antitoxin system RelE/ParE family toxin [Tessaracoccus caeni]